VQLVLDSRRSVREVAAELGINHETPRNWTAVERQAWNSAARQPPYGPLSSSSAFMVNQSTIEANASVMDASERRSTAVSPPSSTVMV
jgi:transposase-like protein